MERHQQGKSSATHSKPSLLDPFRCAVILQDRSQIQPGEDRGDSCTVTPPVLSCRGHISHPIAGGHKHSSQGRQELSTWHEEVKQGPQLQNVILDGRPTQQEAVLSTDALAGLQLGVQL